MTEQVTPQDLVDAKLDCNTIAEVATSDEETTIDRIGNEKRTLTGAILKLGYEAPVAYASSLSMTNGAQTVDHDGIIYAAKPSAVPFTTSDWATDAIKFRLLDSSSANSAAAAAIAAQGAAEASQEAAEDAAELAGFVTLSLIGAKQSRLSISGSDLLLSRQDGNQIVIDGVIRSLPASGPVLGIGSASANTTYYIYAYWDEDDVQLEFSATSYSADSDLGIMVKTGDESRTLVGMARTNATPAWELVRSYFNDPGFVISKWFTTERAAVNVTSYTEIHSEIRCHFLVWNNEVIDIQLNGTIRIDASGREYFTSIGIDGSTPDDVFAMEDSYSASANISPCIVFSKAGLAEGLHYATVIGKGSASDFSGHFAGGSTAGLRTTLRASCASR